jgi:predicted lipoprotein with Yx(FWY)xxD motif
MRTTVLGFALGALVVAFGAGLSAETKTITGALVDTKCNTKQGAKAAEADHADCAVKCAKSGAPLAVVNSDGVFLVTGAWTDNKNEKLIEFAGKKVQATGNVTEKDGAWSIELASVKPAGM